MEMATSYRHGGYSRKLRAHTFHHKQEAERATWKWPITLTVQSLSSWLLIGVGQRSGIPDQFSEVFTP